MTHTWIIFILLTFNFLNHSLCVDYDVDYDVDMVKKVRIKLDLNDLSNSEIDEPFGLEDFINAIDREGAGNVGAPDACAQLTDKVAGAKVNAGRVSAHYSVLQAEAQAPYAETSVSIDSDDLHIKASVSLGTAAAGTPAFGVKAEAPKVGFELNSRGIGYEAKLYQVQANVGPLVVKQGIDVGTSLSMDSIKVGGIGWAQKDGQNCISFTFGEICV